MRQPLIAGNWKMHKTVSEAVPFVRGFSALAPLTHRVEIAFAPPFIALHAVGQALASSPFKLAAQNLFWEDEGAYTGEVSAVMLKDVGCHYVIIGHSERRRLFGDHNEGINKKLHVALDHHIAPIFCVGESLEEREKTQTEAVIREQILKGLQGVKLEDLKNVTIAYEPVWAIGTGRAASLDQIEPVHALIRATLELEWGTPGLDTRILYGGSVTPDNAAALFCSPQIDGALVGKACLDHSSFARIAELASQASQ